METQESISTIRIFRPISGFFDQHEMVTIKESDPWMLMTQPDRLEYWLLSKEEQVLLVIRHQNDQPLSIVIYVLKSLDMRSQEIQLAFTGIALQAAFLQGNWELKIVEKTDEVTLMEYSDKTLYLEKLEAWIDAIHHFQFPFNITDYRLLASHI